MSAPAQKSPSDIMIGLFTEMRDLLRVIAARSTATQTAGDAATDRELDGRWGDPQVPKVTPRGWTGESMAGRSFSQCPPDFLDLLAGFFDWAAEQADKKGEKTPKGTPLSDYKRKDARLARGWARRNRLRGATGTAAPATPQGDAWASTSDPWAKDEAPY